MSTAPDIDDLVANLSIQNFRPIRGGLYSALTELREARAALARVEAVCAEVEADDERHLNEFGQHLPGSVVCVAEMIRAALAGTP